MNKSKLILAVTGGVIGVAVLVMAYFVWAASAAKTAALEGDDENEGLETVEAQMRQLTHKPVYPSAASLKAIASNEEALVSWTAEARKLAARGDLPEKPTTPAQFKTDMVLDAKMLLMSPGAVQGHLAKADFAFGPFKDYISEGKMPAEAQLKKLQREWDDVRFITEILVTNNVSELVDVQFKAAKAQAAEEEQPQPARKGKKKARKAANAAKAEPADDAQGAAREEYVFTFRARPLALVKVLNRLATCERFVTVEGLSFSREADAIGLALGDGGKKDAQQQTGRRRRRGQVQEVKTEEKAKAENGIVTDPLLDAPLKVELTVAIYDFRTLEETPKEEKK